MQLNIIEEVGSVLNLPAPANQSAYALSNGDIAQGAAKMKRRKPIAANLLAQASALLRAGEAARALDLLAPHFADDGQSPELIALQFLYLEALAAVGRPALALQHWHTLLASGVCGVTRHGVLANGRQFPRNGVDQDWAWLRADLLGRIALQGNAPASTFSEAALAFESVYESGCISASAADGSGVLFSAAAHAAIFWLLAGEREQACYWVELARTQKNTRQIRTDDEHFEFHYADALAQLVAALGATSDVPAHAVDVEAALKCLRRANTHAPTHLQRRADVVRLLKAVSARFGANLPETQGLLVGAIQPAQIFHLLRLAPESQGLPLPFDEQGSADVLGQRLLGAQVYCVVNDPADVRAIEWLKSVGARVHVVLADPLPEFRGWFARRFDAFQAQRMVSVVEGCASISVARGLLADEVALRREYAQAQALGQALGQAQLLSAEVRYLGLSQSEVNLSEVNQFESLQSEAVQSEALQSEAGYSETLSIDSVTMMQVRETSAPQRMVDCAAQAGKRRQVGILFADFMGFRRVGDEVIQQFWNEMFMAFGRLMEPFSKQILLGKTWGDGLHLVTADAQTAVTIAQLIQHYVQQRRLETDALAQLDLRVAVHYGPVFCEFDPLAKTPVFLGTSLTFAARIEPVTPPGQIYATESLAAQLALENGKVALPAYVGEVDLAKDFGRYRLYSLEARPS